VRARRFRLRHRQRARLTSVAGAGSRRAAPGSVPRRRSWPRRPRTAATGGRRQQPDRRPLTQWQHIP
jgi:hypothetical protein